MRITTRIWNLEATSQRPRELLGQVAEACRCADHLLEHYAGIRVEKALRLDTPDGFDLAVALLAEGLRHLAHKPEREAIKEALAVLDVDWPATAPAQRKQLLRQAQSAAAAQL